MSAAGAGAAAIVITNNNPRSTPWSGLRIYKEPNNPFVYGSDRNGGLYVFKLKRADSGKV